MLKLGDKGKDVDEVQAWLVKEGFLDKKETYYSIKTKNAVQKLQKACGFKQTGEFDNQLKVVYNMNKKTTYGPKKPQDGVVQETQNSVSQAKFNFRKFNTGQKIPCYVQNLLTGTTIILPHVPDEVAQSKGNSFEEMQTKGRSAPFLGYSGSTSKTMDITVTLSADYCENRDLDSVLNKVIALAYPRYGDMVVPPKCACRVASVMVEGVLNEVSITRRLPIINGAYSIADVTFSFTEAFAQGVTAPTVEKGEY